MQCMKHGQVLLLVTSGRGVLMLKCVSVLTDQIADIVAHLA